MSNSKKPPSIFAKNLRLHRSPQALLYDIAKRIRSGYVWWLIQEVSEEKILYSTSVLSSKYGSDKTSVERSAAKKRGEISTTIFVWPVRRDPAGYTKNFRLLLLSTEHLDGEVMFDARRKPININFYANKNAVFRLKGTPKEQKQTKSKKSTKHKKFRQLYTWDWSLTAQSVQVMRDRFTAEHANPAGLQKLRAAYVALPMTRGYRQQLKAVLTDTRVMWKRSTTPAVKEYKNAIKEGKKTDPLTLKNLPFIRGFPKLYDDPPMTLENYLIANKKLARQIRKQQKNTVQNDHEGVSP